MNALIFNNRATFAPLLALLLCSCAVSTQPQLGTVQVADAVPATLAIEPLPNGQGGSALVTRFEAMVRKNLADRGITVDQVSTTRLTITLVQRSAVLGVTADKEVKSKQIDWVSQPHQRGPFQRCVAQRIEGGLVLSGVAAQAKTALAYGEFDTCAADDRQLQALAGLLVTGLLDR